ncbi:hypothetical protein THRCLA_22628 [Thraustotheca clavata]|uniref:Uncharacterized protein n=1 Tax=Thraustotheca clavata TaxID=74557 RepID=A0A1V9YVS8_9STRA|nr:hypothetical protein THRCLA_22628 [Thraustotheca clavata]
MQEARHEDPDELQPPSKLNVVPSGQPVKYLGILFGHKLPQDLQIHRLNDKFLSAFQLWGSRARTIKGCKLIVSTMLLSLLWHVTAVVPVPASIVSGWQSMINKHIFGRKTLQSDSYRPLINSTWQYENKLGLGIPHLASKLRTQRLMRLQTLMQQDPLNLLAPWKYLVQRQFSRTLNKLFRTDYPFDFLQYYPNPSSKWLYLWELQPLWHDIWRHWAAVPLC